VLSGNRFPAQLRQLGLQRRDPLTSMSPAGSMYFKRRTAAIWTAKCTMRTVVAATSLLFMIPSAPAQAVEAETLQVMGFRYQ
jgi:hypothetical protein